jgi:hypothetical protein
MKTIVALLASLLVATNAAWLYRALDHGIAESYRAQERYENANRLIVASTIAAENVRGKPKAEVEALLRKLFPSEQPFEKDGALQTNWIFLPLNPDGNVGGVAIDPGIRKVAALANPVVVDIEIFYPSASSGSSHR